MNKVFDHGPVALKNAYVSVILILCSYKAMTGNTICTTIRKMINSAAIAETADDR